MGHDVKRLYPPWELNWKKEIYKPVFVPLATYAPIAFSFRNMWCIITRPLILSHTHTLSAFRLCAEYQTTTNWLIFIYTPYANKLLLSAKASLQTLNHCHNHSSLWLGYLPPYLLTLQNCCFFIEIRANHHLMWFKVKVSENKVSAKSLRHLVYHFLIAVDYTFGSKIISIT